MSAAPATMPRLVCAGCGTQVDALTGAGPTWRCPHAGEGDVDHVLRPEGRPALSERRGGERGSKGARTLRHPFVLYRDRLTVHAAALALGMTDAEFVARVEALDARVAEVDGHGFRVTPTRLETALASGVGLPCGQLVAKVECGNVSGSHKARHLFGLALWLEVERRARERGVLPRATSAPARLAIASCGNAALAAAVVARAAGHELDVFVPTWASAPVVARLRDLGATVTACARTPGVAGDPCYHAFRDATARGAVPFCCQGPDNGLTIEGGTTLAWEMLDALDDDAPDAMFVQVGGGALATAVAQGFLWAHRAGRVARAPRLHAVQTHGCAPLVRAYDRVATRVLGEAGLEAAPLDMRSDGAVRTRIERAGIIAGLASSSPIDAALRVAATHRSAFMQPWDTEPQSVATGILDDETYDWLAIVEAMLRTGGYPVLAAEDTLRLANRLVHDATGLEVCMTGTAGLAGVMDALPHDARLSRERLGVVFSGATR